MQPSAPQTLPAWVNRKMALWGTGLLGLAMLLTALSFIWLEHKNHLRAETSNNDLFARTLESHISLTLNTAKLTLQGLARSAEAKPQPDSDAELSSRLSLPLASMPYVRSLSLLDAKGRVIASSNASNVGLLIPLHLLQQKEQQAPQGLGHLMVGRDLNHLAQQTQGKAETAAQAKHFLLPLTWEAPDPQGPQYWVAALNPDYFANFFALLIGEGEHHAALLGLNGELISSTQALELKPGTRLSEHAAFKQAVPLREFGSFRGEGLDQQASIGSYRLVRDQPLALIVELPMSVIWSHWTGDLQLAGLALSTGLLVIGGLGAMAWRALSAYDSARLHLEAALRNLANRDREQSLLINNVQELMFHTDAKGLLQFINHPEFLGVSNAESLIGLPFESLVDPADQARARGLYRSTAGFLNLPVTLRLAAKKGRKRVLEVSVTPIKNEDDMLLGYVGFALDVTEREDARLRLQAQLEFTARLIDVCPIPIFAKDLALRFVMVNQAWTDMTGVEKNLALGRKLSELRPAALADPVEARDKQLLTQGGSEHLEVQDRGRNFLTHRAVYLDAAGKPAGVLASAIDISRFVEAERQIAEARDAAERANSIKTEFVANMSHELRTPLQSIIGFSELGIERSGEHARLQDMFALIHSSGLRMLDLVNNLLDLSKLESTIGNLSLNKQDLAPLVSAVVNEMRPQADKQNIQLDLQVLDPDLLASVDATRLQQALRNVIDNALRYSPPAGQIKIQLFRDTNGSCIHVIDQGPGIPVAEFESIFEPFSQSALNKKFSSTAHGQGSKGGTGLGLAVCRRILSAHGGSISARNHAQGGAQFELRLPAA
ncbi:ATP-binding protein [Roseateles sp.]|uniref:ATP-binding protein n=1 Tax=Roseateles sp. TaxID=1971397 RepID=UPI003BA48133